MDIASGASLYPSCKGRTWRKWWQNQLTGAYGADVYINVPIGTIALKMKMAEIIGEIMEDGQEIIIMKGGMGGLGNEHFKSSTNQTPRYAQPGMPGEEGYVVLNSKF